MTKPVITTLAMLVVLLLVSASCVHVAEAQSGSRCRTQLRVLVNACKSVLARVPPSAYCCQRLRRTPFSCICPIVTPQIAALIDINYAVKVIRRCGRRIPRRFKCGSITIP